jgi:hypothetical protein
MPGFANQLQLRSIPHAIDPVLWPGRAGLVAGKMAHICEPLFKVLHHGTFVRARQILASSTLPMDVRFRQPLGD